MQTHDLSCTDCTCNKLSVCNSHNFFIPCIKFNVCVNLNFWQLATSKITSIGLGSQKGWFTDTSNAPPNTTELPCI